MSVAGSTADEVSEERAFGGMVIAVDDGLGSRRTSGAWAPRRGVLSDVRA
jgi:hypothetical protein